MKILVVDDDHASRLIAKATVEQAGHECVLAADGDSAWQLVQALQPQVVVTDRMMPGMDGLALCRAIRAAERDSYTYLILVSSLGAQEDIVAGNLAGADDYVTKPLDPFALQARLLVAERVTALHARLGRYRTDLSEQARTDPLTKLHNRLRMTEDLYLVHSRSQRHSRDYSIAIFDVDEFKSYNDIYGHQAGDEALRNVAATLASHARQEDSIYRYGGEEFLLLLPEIAGPAAVAAVDRLRVGVQNLRIEHRGGPVGVLTVSAGISAFVPGSPDDPEQVLHEADMALYAAKAAGRNRVSVAVPAFVGSGPMSSAARGITTG